MESFQAQIEDRRALLPSLRFRIAASENLRDTISIDHLISVGAELSRRGNLDTFFLKIGLRSILFFDHLVNLYLDPGATCTLLLYFGHGRQWA